MKHLLNNTIKIDYVNKVEKEDFGTPQLINLDIPNWSYNSKELKVWNQNQNQKFVLIDPSKNVTLAVVFDDKPLSCLVNFH